MNLMAFERCRRPDTPAPRGGRIAIQRNDHSTTTSAICRLDRLGSRGNMKQADDLTLGAVRRSTHISEGQAWQLVTRARATERLITNRDLTGVRVVSLQERYRPRA